MNGLVKYLIFFMLAFACRACIIPFDPDIERYEDVVIIDAIVTNEPDSSLVCLSRSLPVRLSNFPSYKLEKVPERGAVVYLEDDEGEVVLFSESTDSGKYRPDIPGFRGVTGRSYQLFVTTADEADYESDPVTLKEVPEIENVYAEWGVQQTEEGELEKGFHIYIDTYDSANSTRFYRYEYAETWEFRVPYPSRLELQNEEVVYRTEDLEHCWRTLHSTDIMIISNEKLETDVVKKFPVHFVSTETSRLITRYSIEVLQYSLSKEAYIYWEQLRGTNQDKGSLFDSQPIQPRGNICNSDDPEAPVIGFFEASSVSRKRIFLTRWDIPEEEQKHIKIMSGYENCSNIYWLIPTSEFEALFYEDYCLVKYTTINSLTPAIGLTRSFRCCDCTTLGTNVRPDFW